ncbi:hypothetical protein HJC23_010259 [Cyclotella cryptica]|uniref:Sulfotransferase n=1 Tax=Cyclotella cryptica TaxID=29204 RepID=A0ABD3Q125_9STRA|eukprot:CCRYP_009872-RA/>CCRYP_009872-RA protein AED:0.00 eAED:0.00 QI:123/1/1/1/1/1/3/137/401
MPPIHRFHRQSNHEEFGIDCAPWMESRATSMRRLPKDQAFNNDIRSQVSVGGMFKVSLLLTLALSACVVTYYWHDHDRHIKIGKIDVQRLREVNASDVGEPFYRRWPESKLPPYALKSKNYNTPREASVCFVHVGKTAGSTVGCYLGFSHHCNDTGQLDGVLPMITTHLFHNDVYNCYDDTAHFLFIVRDPIERAKSAFYYSRPDEDCDDSVKKIYNPYYKDCPFWSFEAMIQNGLDLLGDASVDCKIMADQSIKGLGETGPTHFYYNYQYYFEAIPKNAKIIAIRSEYLVEDWNNLEKLFGGRDDTLTPTHLSHNNINVWLAPEDLIFTDESREIVCRALCNEILVYKKILQLAENLVEQEVERSLAELKAKCPEIDLEVCPERLPDIALKIEENRGIDH